jgi:hypothetical protein
MSKYTQQWIGIIDAVRGVFSGPLTYAALAFSSGDAEWSEWQNVRFWDRLDYVGMDVYFPLTKQPDPSVGELQQAWRQHVANIEAFQRSVNKPIVFTETG